MIQIQNLSELILYQINVRSMRSNFNSVLAHLGSENIEPHILILTEVWIEEEELPLYKLENFNSYICARTRNRAGGVVAFVRGDIPCNVEPITKNSFEMLKIEITGTKNQSINVLACYRDVSSQLTAFNAEIDSVLGALRGDAIFLGDINVNIRDKNTRACIDYEEPLSALGYRCCHREITGRASGSCLDHVYLKSAASDARISIDDNDITDHSAVLAGVETEVPIQEKPKSKSFLDHNLFKTEIRHANWNPIFEELDVEEALNKFYRVYEDIKRRCCKTIKFNH